MSDLWTWANDNSGGLALLGVAFPLLILAIGFLASHFRAVPTEKMLRDPASWSALAQTYQSSGSDAYFQSLDRVLGFANRWYGERLLSWRAYGTCLTLAFVYPLLALLIGWGLFNIWAPAGISIFRDTGSGFERALRLVLFAAGAATALNIVKNEESFSQFVVNKLFKPLDDPNTRPSFLSKVGRVLVEVLAFAFAFAFAVVAAVAVAVAFAVVAADIDAALMIFLLYVLLPVLNAAADLLSLAITRFFLARVLAQRPVVWIILAQMLLDLALAACCLLLLLAALVGALEIWSALSPATAPLDWRAFWASIHADPKQGITLYLMAATTLVPTLVHLIAGLGAVWTQKSRLLHPVAAKLAAQPVTKPFAEIEIDQMLRTIGRATLWGYARASVAVILPTAILLWIAYSLII